MVVDRRETPGSGDDSPSYDIYGAVTGRHNVAGNTFSECRPGDVVYLIFPKGSPGAATSPIQPPGGFSGSFTSYSKPIGVFSGRTYILGTDLAPYVADLTAGKSFAEIDSEIGTKAAARRMAEAKERRRSIRESAGNSRGFFLIFLVISIGIYAFGAWEYIRYLKMFDAKAVVTSVSEIGTRYVRRSTGDDDDDYVEEPVDYQWLSVTLDGPGGKEVNTKVVLDGNDALPFPARIGDQVPVILEHDTWSIGRKSEQKAWAIILFVLGTIMLLMDILIHSLRIASLKRKMQKEGMIATNAFGGEYSLEDGANWGGDYSLEGSGGSKADNITGDTFNRKKNREKLQGLITAFLIGGGGLAAVILIIFLSGGFDTELSLTDEAGNGNVSSSEESHYSQSTIDALNHLPASDGNTDTATLKADGTLSGITPQRPTELGIFMTDNIFQVNNTLYQLPVPIGQFYDDGWIIFVDDSVEKSASAYSYDPIDEDTKVPAHGYEPTVYFHNVSGDKFFGSIVNFSEEEASARDCALTSFVPLLAGGDTTRPLPCSISGGISSTMSQEEFDAKIKDLGADKMQGQNGSYSFRYDPVPVDDRIILTTSFYGFYDTEHQRLTIDYGVHVAIDGKDIY